MSGSTWVVLIVAVVICAAWELLRAKKQHVPPQPRKAPVPPNLNYGKPPHPVAHVTDMPGGGMRIIDLRGLPAADLTIGKLDVVHAQLRLERPIPVQVWVVELEIARAWAAMSGTAQVIIRGHLQDPRFPDARRLVYTMGGKLTGAETEVLGAAGIEVVLEYTNLSDPPKSLEAFVGTPEPYAPSKEDRPVPSCTPIATGPLSPAQITVVEGFGYIDLRRTAGKTPSADVFGRFLEVKPLTHVVWVAAPWVLEKIPDEQLAAFEALSARIPSSVEQRLAIVAPEGEPIGDYAFTRRLGPRLRPIAERMQWKTADGNVFDIRPLDALHDAYFHRAWKLRREV